jgi:hypothetical protein
MEEQYNIDQEAIKQAILDYAEGVYKVDPSRIERSVHTDLVKGGFFKEGDKTSYSFTSMTFDEMVELSKSYNKNGMMPQDAPRDVTIFNATDQIASAKLIAWWGIDYMHLAKYDGKWKIIHVLWQTYPQQDNRLANKQVPVAEGT